RAPRIVARFVSSEPGRTDAVSLAVRIRSRRGLPRRAALTLLPIVVVLAVSAWAWARARRRRNPRVDAPDVEVARRRAIVPVRRTLSVRVVARRDGSPIAHARVQLCDPSGAIRHAVADADGRATFGPLDDGISTARIEARGHSSVEFTARIPHR